MIYLREFYKHAMHDADGSKAIWIKKKVINNFAISFYCICYNLIITIIIHTEFGF
jgi:hypothetical protein